jgi:hypothetical protein
MTATEIKLQPFWLNRVADSFTQAEAIFIMRYVSDSLQRCCHLLSEDPVMLVLNILYIMEDLFQSMLRLSYKER